MELELVVLVFASFRAYRMLTILAFESKSSSLCEQIQDHGTGRPLPARSRLRSRKGDFDRLACPQFLGILDLVQAAECLPH